MKKIKNIMKPLWSFVAWLIIAVIVYFSIYAGLIPAAGGSVFIVCSLFLGPCFLISCPLVDRLLKWAASNMDSFRRRLEPLWTVSTPTEPNKREDNPLFWRILHIIIFGFWFTLTLLAFFIPIWSKMMVYTFAHSIKVILCNMFSDSFKRTTVFIWIIISVIFISITVWFVRKLFEPSTTSEIKHRVIVFAISFAIHRILSYLLLEYTVFMVVTSVIFWIVLVIMLIVVPIFVAPAVWRLISKIFS